MSFRHNAVVLTVLAGLMAIVGAWSDDTTLARMWLLPVALLLIGLTYEAWFVARAGLKVAADAEQQARLGLPPRSH